MCFFPFQWHLTHILTYVAEDFPQWGAIGTLSIDSCTGVGTAVILLIFADIHWNVEFLASSAVNLSGNEEELYGECKKRNANTVIRGCHSQ